MAILSLLSQHPKIQLFSFKKIGLKTHQVKNTLIIGGGTISYYLAKALSDLKISVKIIDKNKERCEELSEMLPNATIICGDGTDRALLMEEGLSTVESFAHTHKHGRGKHFPVTVCKKYDTGQTDCQSKPSSLQRRYR